MQLRLLINHYVLKELIQEKKTEKQKCQICQLYIIKEKLYCFTQENLEFIVLVLHWAKVLVASSCLVYICPSSDTGK